jgi:hypothetical protein
VSGSYYERPYLPPENARGVRVGPLVGAVLVTGILSSGVGAILISVFEPAGRLAAYVIPLVAWMACGMLLLPSLVRSFAGVRITAEIAFFALLAGAVTTFALRFAIAEVLLGSEKRFAQPTPGALGGALVLTWGASLVGAWISANIIREHAKALSTTRRSGAGSVVGLPVLLVIGAGLMFAIAIAVSNRNITNGGSTAKQATAGLSGLSLLVYGEQLDTSQRLVLDSYRVVTTSKASSAAHLLRANIGALSGRARYLAATSPPGKDTLASHQAYVAGLQSFVTTLPRVASLRTSRAQRRAFRRAPGLRTMYSALTDLNFVLRRQGLDRDVFDPQRWSAMLHGRTLGRSA